MTEPLGRMRGVWMEKGASVERNKTQAGGERKRFLAGGLGLELPWEMS